MPSTALSYTEFEDKQNFRILYMINVMNAFLSGSIIECALRNPEPEYKITKNPSWDWATYTYRVRPVTVFA